MSGAFLVVLIFSIGHRKSNILKTIYYSIAGFFGQTGGILSYTDTKNNKSVILAIICFVIIYFISVFITALTTAKSVQFFNKSDKLEYSIYGEKILVNINDLSSELIPRNNGTIADINKINSKWAEYLDKHPFEFFIENKEKMKLSGILYSGLSNVDKLALEHGLKVSSLVMGSYRVSFPVKKEETKLLSDLNYIIQSMEDEGTILKSCDLWVSRKHVMC